MHKFCESIPFAGLKFDQAIRVFLQGFRLPGGAEDRPHHGEVC